MHQFEVFSRERWGDLKRIAYATQGELTADDLSSEARLLAIEIEEKLERRFDFACKLDQDRLLAWMYARFVKFADKAVRHAVRLDKGWDDEAEEGLGSRIARMLLAPEHSDPHRQHGALDEAAELRTEIQKSYSEAAAYTILLIRTEWDLPALAEDLLTGARTVRARIGRAVGQLEAQFGLFDAVDRVDWEFSPRRKRRLQGKSVGSDSRQLALDKR